MQKMNTLNNSTIDTKNLVGENVDDMTKTFGTFKAGQQKMIMMIFTILF